jgi:hypothetical protein
VNTVPAGERPAPVPPPLVEMAVGALVADGALREAILGDLAEEFALRCERHGAPHARRWYRGEAARSALPLVAAAWWPAPRERTRRVAVLATAVIGGSVLLQLIHQAAQLLAMLTLAAAGVASQGPAGGTAVACSLVAALAAGVLGGYAAARMARRAPLAAALALALACGAFAVVGMLVNGGATPLWYWVGVQLLLLPVGACAGGFLRVRRATTS